MKLKQILESSVKRVRGMGSAALASFFLGWAPILGKLAYETGVGPFTLTAVRTLIAAGLLWIVYLIFLRSFVRIDWRDWMGCTVVGAINGVGSLFYYSGLQRLDASRAAFLNDLYPLWVVIFLTASGEPLRWLTILRLGLALLGVQLLAGTGIGAPDLLGVALMIASAATYGWYLVMGQWVLADVPSQTATLYILTSMGGVVGLARLLQGQPMETVPLAGWGAITALGITTVLSRLLMFAGLKELGGVETSLISLLELVVSLGLAFVLLGERLTLVQWMGGAILITSVLMERRQARPTVDDEWWQEWDT